MIVGGEPRGSVQPGGRDPAPGELALVQAFINSHYDLEREHGAELFLSPAALRRWLGQHGLIDPGVRVSTSDLARAIELRERLREVARHQDPELLDELAGGAAVEVRFNGSRPSFVAATDTGVVGAFGVLLATTAAAILDGTWARLKVCPGRDCGWAFYDHSRNRSGRWCAMSVCGGRAKARAHYRRRTGRV